MHLTGFFTLLLVFNHILFILKIIQQIQDALSDPALPLRSRGTWGPLIDPFDLVRISEHHVTSRSIEMVGSVNPLPKTGVAAARRVSLHKF